MKNETQFNSRLGRVLVNKGYISEQQLDHALVIQGETGQRLGEVLVSEGLLSQTRLNNALKRQSIIRKAGALAAVLTTPFYASTTFAVSLSQSPSIIPKRGDLGELQTPDLPTGLVPLSESELIKVSAQSSNPLTSSWFANLQDLNVSSGRPHTQAQDEEEQENTEERIAEEVLDNALTVAGFGPLSDMIEAEITVDGFRALNGGQRIELVDGGVKFYNGFEIDRISYENIRVKGSTDPETFGSIYMSDISFDQNSNIIIRGADARW